MKNEAVFVQIDIPGSVWFATWCGRKLCWFFFGLSVFWDGVARVFAHILSSSEEIMDSQQLLNYPWQCEQILQIIYFLNIQEHSAFFRSRCWGGRTYSAFQGPSSWTKNQIDIRQNPHREIHRDMEIPQRRCLKNKHCPIMQISFLGRGESLLLIVLFQIQAGSCRGKGGVGGRGRESIGVWLLLIKNNVHARWTILGSLPLAPT